MAAKKQNKSEQPSGLDKMRDAAAQRQPPQLNAKSLGLRLGIPIAIVWVIAFFVPHWAAKVVAAALTALALGLVWFALRWTSKAQKVQSIVGEAKTQEERAEAIEKIDKEFKKGDSAAVFAKSQLLMQEDPRKALEELEKIDLQKAMPNIADEARAQRAMIHLMIGEAQKARVLVDSIDLGRQMDPKSKATISAVVCEAWARTGAAKKAVDILALFDANDATLVDARPGLLRAQVFAYGALGDTKKARGAMHQLAKVDPRIVAGFAQKGVHPVLVEEAKKILQRAGVMPKPKMMRGPMR